MRVLRFGPLVTALAIFASASSAWGDHASKAGPANDRILGHYIVILEDSVDHPGMVAGRQTELRGGELGFVYRYGLKGYSAKLSEAAVKALRNDPQVRYVTADRKGELASQTTPPGIQRIFAPGLPALDIDEIDDVRVDVDVAIIDTGINPAHSDLNVVERTDCTVEEACLDGQGTDTYGHGTHVGGIVGAIDNNLGVVGVAPGARLWAVRVGQSGSVPLSSTLAGIEWVTAHAAQIEAVNMSILFSGGHRAVMEEAIEAAVDAGVVFVVAAGNENDDAENYSPSSFEDVITVSALSDYDGIPGGLGKEKGCGPGGTTAGLDDKLGAYSNWGPAVDIAAPGSCVYSTAHGGGYTTFTGTSMAAPHVAGGAAILASESNPEDREDVEAIQAKLEEEGSLDWVDDTGDGIHEPLLDLRPPAREAITHPASNLHPFSAQLNGVANAGGLESTFRFEYGETTEYAHNSPAKPLDEGSGTGDIEVYRQIQVEPETTYHYRVVVTNSGGTSYGDDQELTTSTWDVRNVPGPNAEGASELEGVSCLTRNDCVGVGYEGHPLTPRHVVERWDGTEWTVQATPSPEGGNPELNTVSCASTSFCMAVGLHTSGGRRPFAERWNGSEWTVLTMPFPGDAVANLPATLGGVSCPSATFCVVVGSYVSAYSTKGGIEEKKALVGLWDGSKWTIQSVANPAGQAFVELSGVSCTSSSACTAVGRSLTSGAANDPKTLALRWNGSTWTVQATPNPSGAKQTFFEDVSCATGAFCMAVGNSSKSESANTLKNSPEGLTASWDGTEWDLLSSNLAEGFSGISCPTVVSCRISSLQGHFGQRWNGVEWSPESTASPEGATLARLNDISCPEEAGCAAVGSFTASRSMPESGRVPLADHLLGPTAATEAATSIELSDAVLNGTVNPNGGKTYYRFEYGKTTSYGQFAPAEAKIIGAGYGNAEVVASAGSLTPGTTYHYRVVATNGVATMHGADMTFTTGRSPRWFTCTSQGGGKYTSNKCSTEGAPNTWESVALKEGEKTNVTAKGETISLTAFPGNVKSTLKCETEVTSASLENPSGGGNGIAAAQLKFKGCIGELGWASCKITPSAATIVKLELSSFEGKAYPLITAKEVTNMGSFVIAECVLAGTYELTGTLRGLYSNSASKIEFSSETEGNMLKLNVTGVGLKTTPAGSIGLTTSGGASVKALAQPAARSEDASAVKSSEATLNGTVNPGGADTHYQFEYGKTTSYGQSVPAEAKSADKGLTDVKVAETISGLVSATTYHFRLKATDGTTTSYGADKTFTTPAPPLHWLACKEQGGGKYTSNKCSTEGAPNTWESVALKEGESTAITAKGNQISLTAFPGNVKSTLKCETEVTSASLENPSGGGNGIAAAQLKFKGCIGELGWAKCKITPSAATAVKLVLSTVEGKAYPLITAKEGANMASFVLTECSLAGTYELTGTLRGLYSNSASKIEFSSETEGNMLKLNVTGVGLKTTPAGSIGLETTAGGSVRAG